MKRLSGVIYLSHLFIFSIIIIIPTEIFAQYIPRSEKGDPTARRMNVMDANAVRTTLFNFGISGRTKAVPDQLPFEWPRGTHQYYIAQLGMFIGGEVVNVYGDTIHIVDVPTYRESPDEESWNFEPVPEYQNLNVSEFARSDDPTTWPDQWPDKINDPDDPGWPGSWNSVWGKNVFFADQEFYYHMSDDLYDRYAFYPDSTDSTRRGLGLVVSQRIMEFKFFQDAVFYVSDIYNVGTTDISRSALTFMIRNMVGGDISDDLIQYNLKKRIIYFLDADGIGEPDLFGDDTVGVVALAFLQTPYQNLSLKSEEQNITNIRRDPAGGINFNTVSDLTLWDRYMTPGHYNPKNHLTGEFDSFASVSYFPLPGGRFQRLVSAIIFGKDTVDVKQKLDQIRAVFPDIVSGSPDLSVSISSPTTGQSLSAESTIQWNTQNSDTSIRVTIFHSRDVGEPYRPIAWGLPNTGSYLWDTNTQPDGIFNKVKILAVGDSTFGMVSSDSFFTINNSEPTPPQIMLTSPPAGSIYQNSLPIEWVAGDADEDSIQINLSYSISDSTFNDTIVSGLSNTGFYNWNISGLPNSAAYKLKATAHDGQLSGIDTISYLEIFNPRDTLSSTAQTERHTIGTGLIEVHVANPTDLTGHNYRVEFNVPPEGPTTYDVIDETQGLQLITASSRVNGIAEGPLFDGVRLYIQNDSTRLNNKTSGWNNSQVHDFKFEQVHFLSIKDVRDPSDFRVEFGKVGLDTSKTFTLKFLEFPSKPVNFTIENLTTGEPQDFAFMEVDGNNGQFTIDPTDQDRSDWIVLLKKMGADSLAPSWSIFLRTTSGSRHPQPGDTLFLNLKKAFQDSDYYNFETVPTLLKQTTQPEKNFMLDHNYPNPFNPVTTIRFQIGNAEIVKLIIYDILGREIRNLIDDELTPGNYSVKWNGLNEKGLPVASGIYVYQLTAGNFKKTRKMLLLR